MAEIFGLKLNGLEKLKLKTAILKKKSRDDLGKAMFIAGARIQVEAQGILTDNKHIVTGALRRSINTESQIHGTSVLKVLVGTHLKYGIDIELLEDGGYLVPALKKERGRALEGMQKAVKDAIKSVGGT